jgi:flagellar basal-body rod protein FlgG
LLIFACEAQQKIYKNKETNMSGSLFTILHISKQDMISRLQDLDTTSNNLANVNTSGYKSTRANFQELLQKAQMGGVTLPSTQLITDQGSMRQTGNALDLAISGQGYFQILMPNGQTGYTRDGEFTLDANLNIVNASGMKLVWQGTIPAGSEAIKVDQDGTVSARTGTTWTRAGQIQLARFINPSALSEKGNNIYQPTLNSGAAVVGNPMSTNFGLVQGGSLEQSNVDSSREMTQMITIQRDFQISARAFTTTDTMIEQAIQMRRA